MDIKSHFQFFVSRKEKEEMKLNLRREGRSRNRLANMAAVARDQENGSEPETIIISDSDDEDDYN